MQDSEVFFVIPAYRLRGSIELWPTLRSAISKKTARAFLKFAYRITKNDDVWERHARDADVAPAFAVSAPRRLGYVQFVSRKTPIGAASAFSNRQENTM
jgi:hypothetical protein